MKNNFSTLACLFFLCSINLYTQKNEEVSLIDLDNSWGKEIFKFPISFAPSINYQGIEEARFPPTGWSDVQHPNFWSYTFAWNINKKSEITTNDLETDLQKYFDGLMRIDTTEELKAYKTVALFIKKEKHLFVGKIKTYDRFTTKKPIVLNVLVKSHFCKKQEKLILLFTFSPKNFTHQTWKMLNKIKLVNDYCN
ncbi:hypothetical protein P8625_07870 [Tenacibaculum tangerinum]|uniref:Uncharacterized protein n=1 Tax=Tenacibaculum tangerinum TaxID=3038772 RepID=A0ABY8L7J0_9FLAO|nr:hypothetical protein [Tenacibaculum tangerinum]WGH77041.1 hypothetical protein P8625_07870 [Tenacibaculum tangerinum]